jgi:hypothetical protein
MSDEEESQGGVEKVRQQAGAGAEGSGGLETIFMFSSSTNSCLMQILLFDRLSMQLEENFVPGR